MIRILLFSLCLAVTIASPNVVGQESETTTWAGTLNAGGTRLRLEVSIANKEGVLTGELCSLDQGNTKMELTDIKLDEKSLIFSIPKIGAKFSGKLRKKGTVAKGTFSQSGVSFPLLFSRSDADSADPTDATTETLKEAWVGKLNMGVMEPVMQFRIVTLESGETAAYFDSVTEGRSGFKATSSTEGDELKFDVPKINLTFRGTYNDARDTAEGIWTQGGREIPLTLKKQATEYDNVNVWENRPQRPVGPFPYDAEEVTFENTIDQVTLAGTLTLPQDSGRHPVVVLISGSGPQDRDETLMGHKPFLVLADYLSRRGIAVLRYDDRGTAASTGKFGPATTEDFARDASAAVAFLKKHDRINPTKIGLVGHSEGGLIAPMVVGLRDDIALVVLMAATGVDGLEISLSQTEAMLQAAGTDPAEAEMGMAVNRAVLGAVVKSSSASEIPGNVKTAVDAMIQTIPESDRAEAGKNIHAGVQNQMRRLKSNWMRFFISYDPRPALSKIQCPVLAITGSKDIQVLPELNVPEIKKALTLGGNQDFEMVEIEGLNHLFQKCETGAMSEYITIQETFNPAALEKIGDWIVDHTK